MPISPGLGSIIGGGTSLLGDIFNLFGQSKANREQEAYNTNVMNQQRQWSLEDVAAQNAYNSPVQQMVRLKEAGLNPNLVYGEGIQAAGNSDQPRSVPAPSFSPGNTLSAFSNLGNQTMAALDTGYDLPNKAQSLDNMKAEQMNKEADTAIKKLTGNILKTEPGADPNAYDPIAGEYRSDLVRDIKFHNLTSEETTKANTAAISAAEEYIARNTQNSKVSIVVQQALQAAIDTMKDSIEKDNLLQIQQNLKNTGTLQKLDIQSQTWDFNANSPVWQQVIFKILHAVMSHVTK